MGNQKIVHIHAKCEVFEIWEHIPEKKAVMKLERILANYLKFKRLAKNPDDKLEHPT